MSQFIRYKWRNVSIFISNLWSLIDSSVLQNCMKSLPATGKFPQWVLLHYLCLQQLSANPLVLFEDKVILPQTLKCASLAWVLSMGVRATEKIMKCDTYLVCDICIAFFKFESIFFFKFQTFMKTKLIWYPLL